MGPRRMDDGTKAIAEHCEQAVAPWRQEVKTNLEILECKSTMRVQARIGQYIVLAAQGRGLSAPARLPTAVFRRGLFVRSEVVGSALLVLTPARLGNDGTHVFSFCVPKRWADVVVFRWEGCFVLASRGGPWMSCGGVLSVQCSVL